MDQIKEVTFTDDQMRRAMRGEAVELVKPSPGCSILVIDKTASGIVYVEIPTQDC